MNENNNYKELWKKVFPDYDDKRLYPNGLPFSEELLLNLEEVKKRTFYNPRHLPSAIVIDGASGLGKTTLAFLIGSYLQGSPLDMDFQRGIGIKEFLAKAIWVIKNNKKVIIYDEAGDFERKATNTKASRVLNRFFDLYRTFAIVPIIVLPSFLKLDSGLFINKIPRFLIHLKGGDDNATYYDGYSLAGMMKIRHYFYYNQRFIPILEDVFKKFQPTFRGGFLKPPDNVLGLVDKKSDDGKLLELARLLQDKGSFNPELLPDEVKSVLADAQVDFLELSGVRPKKKELSEAELDAELKIQELLSRPPPKRERSAKERPDYYDFTRDVRWF